MSKVSKAEEGIGRGVRGENPPKKENTPKKENPMTCSFIEVLKATPIIQGDGAHVSLGEEEVQERLGQLFNCLVGSED